MKTKNVDPKHIYDTNQRFRTYVDKYVKIRESGRVNKPITLEEALKHKSVLDVMEYYLEDPNDDDIKIPDFIHDYN